MNDLKNKILLLLSSGNKKTGYYLLAGLIGFLLLGDYIFLMRFQVKALRSLGPEVARYQRDIEQAKYHLERVALYEAQATELGSDFQNKRSRILTQQEIPMILENISRLANKAGVQVNQIMPLRESQKKVLQAQEASYFILPIFVQGQADYHAIGRFFNHIETNDVFLMVESFDISHDNLNTKRHSLRTVIFVFLKEALAL